MHALEGFFAPFRGFPVSLPIHTQWACPSLPTPLQDEVDRSLHDSLCVVKRVLESGTVVPGGGAVEAALSVYLEVSRTQRAPRPCRQPVALSGMPKIFEAYSLCLSQPANAHQRAVQWHMRFI